MILQEEQLCIWENSWLIVKVDVCDIKKSDFELWK